MVPYILVDRMADLPKFENLHILKVNISSGSQAAKSNVIVSKLVAHVETLEAQVRALLKEKQSTSASHSPLVSPDASIEPTPVGDFSPIEV